MTPDIQDSLNRILSDPAALEQVKNLGRQLGLNAEPPPPKAELQPSREEALSGDVMQSVAKLLPLVNSVKSEDDTARLLRSLRPFLCRERQEKLDRAEKMIKLIRVIPLLRENGLF